MDVQSIHGVVMKCDVQLCGDDEHVNVWPHSDGIKREGIPLDRGTLALSLTTFLFLYFLPPSYSGIFVAVDCPSIVFVIFPGT